MVTARNSWRFTVNITLTMACQFSSFTVTVENFESFTNTKQHKLFTENISPTGVFQNSFSGAKRCESRFVLNFIFDYSLTLSLIVIQLYLQLFFIQIRFFRRKQQQSVTFPAADTFHHFHDLTISFHEMTTSFHDLTMVNKKSLISR